ncbi:MAG: hypothetical protein NVS4B13_12200 [Candidatus Elarobacter sp.]
MSSSVPHVDEERWDRNRARLAFARFAELRADRALDSGPDHSGVSEFDRLRNELVVAHLNLVRYLAVKFANRGEALDDLIQVGEWPSLTVNFSIARLTLRLSSCSRRGTLTAQPLSRK